MDIFIEKKVNMNIVYTTNEAFVAKVAAGICSVFENNKDMEEIQIFIIGQDLSEDSIEKFYIIAEQYKRIVTIIPLEKLENYLDFKFDTGGWNPIVLARLLLDRFLPGEIDRVLYLDGDTINISSLKEVWDTDMNDKVIGACIEATVNKKQRVYLGMKNIPYVNAGVLLINLDKWRQEKIGKRILEFYKNNEGKLFANDQDAINGALKNEIYYLSPKYNFYNIYWFYPYKILKKIMDNTFYYSKDIVEDAIKSPAIIHYLGEERPWRAGNRHKYRKEYFKYLNKTPWKNEKMEEGWQIYYVCWGIFNFLTCPFPMLRYKIINGLIPVFMKWRKKNLNKK